MIELGIVDKNCVDPMGRTSLALAIINEDLPMLKLLLSLGVEAQDALLHAISEDFVEAVEILLDHEDRVVASGREHVRKHHKEFKTHILNDQNILKHVLIDIIALAISSIRSIRISTNSPVPPLK
jgi:hypothetical protein